VTRVLNGVALCTNDLEARYADQLHTELRAIVVIDGEIICYPIGIEFSNL
jgi:hypothetical protein